MKSRILAIFAILGTAVALTAVAAPSAMANGSGSCAVDDYAVYFSVTESPGEGDVKTVYVNSKTELSTVHSLSSGTQWGLYNSSGALELGGYVNATPIDGDGYWNYSAAVNYDATTSNSAISTVRFKAVRKSNGHSCGATVYI